MSRVDLTKLPPGSGSIFVCPKCQRPGERVTLPSGAVIFQHVKTVTLHETILNDFCDIPKPLLKGGLVA